jgi:hypothetical protein
MEPAGFAANEQAEEAGGAQEPGEKQRSFVLDSAYLARYFQALSGSETQDALAGSAL